MCLVLQFSPVASLQQYIAHMLQSQLSLDQLVSLWLFYELVSILAVVTGTMTTFRASSELEQYLRGINPNYAKYTQSLWANEVHSTSQLGNASVASILACGVQSAIHAEDIIAQSKPTRNPRGTVTQQQNTINTASQLRLWLEA